MKTGERRTGRQVQLGPDPCVQLHENSTHLGILLGDRDVVFTMAHVAPPRSLAVRKSYSVRMPLRARCTPSLTDLRKAIRTCWREICEPAAGSFLLKAEPWEWENHDTAATFSRVRSAVRDFWANQRLPDHDVYVGLPAWCSDCTDAMSRLRIAHGDGAARRPISETHLREAVQLLCEENTPPGRTAIAVSVEYFRVDDAHEFTDPRGHYADHLEVRGHIFHAEEAFVESLMDNLLDMNLRVLMLATPLMLGSELVPAEDLDTDCAVADVGPRYTCCGFYQRGVMVRAKQVETGTDDLLAAMSARLRVDERELAAVLADKREWLMEPGRYGRQRSGLRPRAGGADLTVQDIVAAAREAATVVFRPIQGLAEAVEKERGFRFRWLTITGDQPVLVKALSEVGEATYPGQCRMMIAPRPVGSHAELPPAEQTRMSGLHWLGALNPPPFQPHLGIYTLPPEEPVLQSAPLPEPSMWSEFSRSWKRAAPRLQMVCETVAQWVARTRAAGTNTASPGTSPAGQPATTGTPPEGVGPDRPAGGRAA